MMIRFLIIVQYQYSTTISTGSINRSIVRKWNDPIQYFSARLLYSDRAQYNTFNLVQTCCCYSKLVLVQSTETTKDKERDSQKRNASFAFFVCRIDDDCIVYFIVSAFVGRAVRGAGNAINQGS